MQLRSKRFFYRVALLVTLSGVGTSSGTVAAGKLSLPEVVDHTLQNLPKVEQSQAFREVASAWQRRGAFWLAGPTTLEATFEHFPGNQNWSGGFNLIFTLWKWNQRASALAVSRQAHRLPQLFNRLLRWEAAGLARDLIWTLRESEVKLRFSKRKLETAKRLLATVERLVSAGELGQRDLLLARNEFLKRLMEHNRIEVEQIHARHNYHLLTGLEELPERIEETRSLRRALTSDHPLLAFLQGKIELFRARSRYAHFESDTGDQQAFLSVGSRHQKGGEHGLTIALSYPIGASPYNAPNVAEQRQQAIEAEVELHQAQRRIKLQLEEIEHRLELDRFRFEQAEQQRQIAEQQLKLADRLFEAGELDLLDYLRLQNQAFEALEAAELARVDYGRDIARYNQIVGEVP